MTYIIGVQYGDFAATICDSMVSFVGSGRDSETTWLKSGLLFHGCTYAYCGDVREAQRFVTTFRFGLKGTFMLGDVWSRFLGFVDAYPFPVSGPGFELLLSTRVFGRPELLVLDSRTRQISHGGSLVTLGSGKRLLDEFVRAQFSQPVTTGNADVDSRPEVAPWMWCLQLMERVQGFETSVLRDAGVGGYFHFGYQSSTEESRQPPAVYVLCDLPPNGRTIPTWVFRIAFCEAALVVECPIRRARFMILDPAAWPAALSFSDTRLCQYRSEIDRKTKEQPFYNFCGFGSVNPALRIRNPAVITNQHDYIVSRSGETGVEFERMVKMVFEDDQQVERSLKELRLTKSPSR